MSGVDAQGIEEGGDAQALPQDENEVAAEGESSPGGTDGEVVERACLQVLTEAAPESLHWTVVLDRALRGRLVSPFEVRDVRKAVGRALALLARQGRVRKVATGVYALPERGEGQGQVVVGGSGSAARAGDPPSGDDTR